MICPLCERAELETFFDGGLVPVFVNVLFDSEVAAKDAPCGRMSLGGCESCGMIHNIAHDRELVRYAPGYENSLHGSPVFQDWASTLARTLVDGHGLAGRRAVEVGGGRGEFMELLVGAGLGRGLVVDPSAPDDSLMDGAAVDDAPVRIERRLFERSDVDADTNLVFTRHVLEHLDDPRGFLATLGEAAQSSNAGLYVEVPNGLWTIRDLGVWDVIYEHCSYFTPSALRFGFDAIGYDAAEITEDFGGQFLCANAPALTGALCSVASTRESSEIDEGALRAAFCDARSRAVEHWDAVFDDWRSSGRRAAIWGAGSKAATFLNTIDGDGVVACAVDVNERKHGRFIAGTGHEIVAPDALGSRRTHAHPAADEIDSIIVMNPRYTREIETMAREAGSDAEVLSIDR